MNPWPLIDDSPADQHRCATSRCLPSMRSFGRGIDDLDLEDRGPLFARNEEPILLLIVSDAVKYGFFADFLVRRQKPGKSIHPMTWPSRGEIRATRSATHSRRSQL